MALEGQPPAYSDHFSASLSMSPWKNGFVQVEGYLKLQENLRFHEINFQNLQAGFNGSPLFNDNEGFSRGVELLFRQTGNRWELSQSYTYSITELRNDRFRNRDWFYADWDRRHRFNTVVSYQFFEGFSASMNWVASSGQPDRIRFSEPEQDRLGIYSRVDLSIEYSGSLGFGNQGDERSPQFRLQAGVYNLTDRNNPWYREWIQTIDDSGIRPRLSPEQVDVYDLGFQPSVSMAVYF
jgi:outer membrane receptor for ferrienterochelin and colicin